MRILLTQRLRDQVDRLEPELQSRVKRYLTELYLRSLEGFDSLRAFLLQNDAKKLQGHGNLRKFRTTDAHRVFFYYSSDLRSDTARNRLRDSIVLLQYVTDHDQQDRVADGLDGLDDPSLDRIGPVDEIDESFLKNYPEWDSRAVIEPMFAVDPEFIQTMNTRDQQYRNIVLMPEQEACLHAPLPLVLTGNAGSGKTLVCLRILEANQQPQEHCLYLTFNRNLSRKIEAEFYKKVPNLSPHQKTVDFRSLVDFCAEMLSRQFTGQTKPLWLVEEEEFLAWFKNLDYIERSGIRISDIDPVDLWSDIHAILKGRFSIDPKGTACSRATLLSFDEYRSSCQKEQTRIHAEQIANAYAVAQKYQRYLENNSKFDDNDLAFLLLQRLPPATERPRYHVVVIDEVQDLTEIQVRLVLEIAENGSKAIFCGDRNQVVNATDFSESMMHSLFQKLRIPWNSLMLQNNFRSMPQVTELVNRLCEARRIHIGRLPQELEQPEISRREGNGFAMLLRPVETELESCVDHFANRADSAVLCLSGSTFDSIAIGDRQWRTFRIHDAKGMEFKYVLCANFISDHIEEWKQILARAAKKSSRHRLLFNYFYVAVSRSTKGVFIAERNPEAGEILRGIAGEFLRYDQDLDFGLLDIADIEDWKIEAASLMETGKFDRALGMLHRYEKYTHPGAASYLIQECEAELSLERGQVDLALTGFERCGRHVRFVEVLHDLGRQESAMAAALRFDLDEKPIPDPRQRDFIRELLRIGDLMDLKSANETTEIAFDLLLHR